MAAGAWTTVTIYALLHPDTKECRYVGKAVDLASRVRNHRWEAKNTLLHTRKVNWLRSLGRDPVLQVLEVVPFDRWAEAERHWILYYRNLGYRLTNHADGGQTSPVEGKGHTEESKAKMREAALKGGARPPSRKGMKATPEAIARMKEAAKKHGRRPPMMGGWNKGKKMPPEIVEANRLGHIGKPWTPARWASATAGSSRNRLHRMHWPRGPSPR